MHWLFAAEWRQRARRRRRARRRAVRVHPHQVLQLKLQGQLVSVLLALRLVLVARVLLRVLLLLQFRLVVPLLLLLRRQFFPLVADDLAHLAVVRDVLAGLLPVVCQQLLLVRPEQDERVARPRDVLLLLVAQRARAGLAGLAVLVRHPGALPLLAAGGLVREKLLCQRRCRAAAGSPARPPRLRVACVGQRQQLPGSRAAAGAGVRSV